MRVRLRREKLGVDKGRVCDRGSISYGRRGGGGEGRTKEIEILVDEGEHSKPIRFMGKGCKFSYFYPCRVMIYGKSLHQLKWRISGRRLSLWGRVAVLTEIVKAKAIDCEEFAKTTTTNGVGR